MTAEAIDLDRTLSIEEGLRAQRDRLVRLCAHLSGDLEAAEDLAQETLATAWLHRDRLRDGDALERWLTAIARNMCRRWSRSQGRERSHRSLRGDTFGVGLDGWELQLQSDFDLEIELEHDELADLLDRAMDRLPRETRDVVFQRFIEDRPLADIAGRLGLSEGAVAMRLQRGKRALRLALGRDFGEESASFGLLPVAGEDWQPTRIWCPTCGAARLRCHIDADGRVMIMRCSECRSETSDRSADFLSQARGPWSALIQSRRRAHHYFREALARGGATCACCGAPAALHMALPPEYPGRQTGGVHVRCERCSAVSYQPASGLVLTLPAVERFWRREKRIRMLPAQFLRSGEQPAILTTFESVTGGSRLNILSADETFEVISVEGSSETAGKEPA